MVSSDGSITKLTRLARWLGIDGEKRPLVYAQV